MLNIQEMAMVLTFAFVLLSFILQIHMKVWAGENSRAAITLQQQNKTLSVQLNHLQVEILALNKELVKLTLENRQLTLEVGMLSTEVNRLQNQMFPLPMGNL